MSANHKNSLRRSKSSASLIPRMTITRPSNEGPFVNNQQSRGRQLLQSETKLRRTNSASSLRFSSTDGPRSSSSSLRTSRQPSTTPLSSNQRTPVRHSSAKKDARPINDKKWQTDQYLKVKRFFADYPEILANLKPLTIQTFVDAMNILFGYIDDRINLSLMNYKEQVPMYMKLLGYPTTISLSQLKCVNTMHSWPVVLAMLSWLVDFIHNVCYSSVTVENIHEESNLHESVANYLFQRYIAWNQSKSEEDEDRRFQSSLFELYGFNESNYLKLENELENLKPQLHKYTKEEDEILEKITALQNEIRTKKEEVYAYKNEPKKSLEEICQDHLKEIKESEKALTERRQQITELNEIISKQPCTFEEFEKRQQKVATLKHDLQLQKEKIEKWVEIIGNCDHELVTTKQKLDRAILDQNLAVMKYEPLNPIIKNLEIQVTGYAQIKDEVERVSQLRLDYHKQFVDDLNAATKQLEDITSTYKQLKHKFESIKDDMEKTKQISAQLNSEVDKYECESDAEIKLLSKQLEKQTAEHKYLLSEKVQLSTEVDALQERITLIEQKIKNDTANLVKMQKETVNFFVHLHNSIIQNFSKLQLMKNAIEKKLKDVMDQRLANKENALEMLKHAVDNLNL